MTVTYTDSSSIRHIDDLARHFRNFDNLQPSLSVRNTFDDRDNEATGKKQPPRRIGQEATSAPTDSDSLRRLVTVAWRHGDAEIRRVCRMGRLSSPELSSLPCPPASNDCTGYGPRRDPWGNFGQKMWCEIAQERFNLLIEFGRKSHLFPFCRKQSLIKLFCLFLMI